jgi:hypothetical protein
VESLAAPQGGFVGCRLRGKNIEAACHTPA